MGPWSGRIIVQPRVRMPTMVTPPPARANRIPATPEPVIRVSPISRPTRPYDHVVAEKSSDLILVAYASAACAPFLGEALGNLLIGARRNNARRQLTGMLLYHQDSFFQVLEGPRAAVTGVYDQISADPRHTKIIKLIEEDIEQRSFADWTMGLGRVERDELGAIPGLNDFFRQGSCYWELEEGRARSLLGAFRDGRWRRTIDA
jgi:hypothetical protein